MGGIAKRSTAMSQARLLVVFDMPASVCDGLGYDTPHSRAVSVLGPKPATPLGGDE